MIIKWLSPAALLLELNERKRLDVISCEALQDHCEVKNVFKRGVMIRTL